MKKAFLYRDPIYDGATDPVVIWNRQEKCWWLLYTQRRSTDISIDKSSIHGSKIGVASSKDGAKWLYLGTLPNLDFERGHNTFWAPEIIYHDGMYHMYVSYITGIPVDWDYPRHIIHYTSRNLWDWNYESKLSLSSESVIDACVFPIDGTWKMWYKDEKHANHTYSAISNDLYTWSVLGPEITDCPHEGPNVFSFGGKHWIIVDCWNGLAVYKSEDFVNWERQKQNLLSDAGESDFDNTQGSHADVVVCDGKALLFYFVHSPTQKDGCANIQLTELKVKDGILCCDRNEDTPLLPDGDGEKWI